MGGEISDFRQAERGDAAVQDEAAAFELRPFQRSFLLRQRVVGAADKIQRLAKQRLESQFRALVGEHANPDLDDAILDRVDDRRGIDVAHVNVEQPLRPA